MRKELNETIARKCFTTLILDYEFDDFVSGRILTDGYFNGYFTAKSREDAIDKFFDGYFFNNDN